MLTPLDFKSNYFSLLAESESITGLKPYGFVFDCYFHTDENDTISAEQWSNLVKVASVIKANKNRFNMKIWHIKTDCGTAHCIAGWAESIAKNDTNYIPGIDETFDTVSIATKMLSFYVSPFFTVIDDNLIPTYGNNVKYKGLAEELVMKWFIDPILEEARKESYELSNEITQFIQKAKEETQSNELITI
jgi:hypothetical protein